MDARAQGTGHQGQTPEEIRKQGWEDWLHFRELIAQGDKDAQARALVAMEFQRLARSHAARRETAADWVTPQKLRDAIERFNREPPELQRAILKGIVTRPAAKSLGDEIKLRQDQIQGRDQGQGLER